MKDKRSIFLPLAMTLMTATHSCGTDEDGARNWPQFRGAGGNAIALDQSIPLPFGPSHNVRWKTAVPLGHSSPCVWNDRVFLTGHVGTALKIMCLDALSGMLRWEHEREIAELPSYVHLAGGPANPTPVTDGSHVVFVFDDYGVIVTDLQGSVLWEKRLPPTNNEYSYGASPVLDRGRIFLNRDGAEEPCLLCLDLGTGDELWRVQRPDANWGFCTPFLLDENGAKRVLVGGTGRLMAYCAETGRLIWHVSGLPCFVCPSPAAAGELIFYGGWTTAHVGGKARVESVFDGDAGVPPEALESAQKFFERYDRDKDQRLSRDELPAGRARDSFSFSDLNQDGFLDLGEWELAYNEAPWDPGRNVLFAVASGGSGDVTATHVRWEFTRGLPYVASPLAWGGRVYLVAKDGIFTCIDARSGDARFTQQRLGVGGEYYSSPVAVGSHILVCAHRGAIFVIRAGDDLEVVHRTHLEEPIFATPAVAGNTIFIRGEQHLWAFGE